jgi:hypothetical protein
VASQVVSFSFEFKSCGLEKFDTQLSRVENPLRLRANCLEPGRVLQTCILSVDLLQKAVFAHVLDGLSQFGLMPFVLVMNTSLLFSELEQVNSRKKAHLLKNRFQVLVRSRNPLVCIETTFLQNVVKLFGLGLSRTCTVQQAENDQVNSGNLDTHKVILRILECVRLKHLVEFGFGVSEWSPGGTVELLSQCVYAAESLIARFFLCA